MLSHSNGKRYNFIFMDFSSRQVTGARIESLSAPLGQESRRPGILEEMTICEVEAFMPEVMLIPLGSTEPHGPHLPYGTDTIIAERVSAEVVRLANLDGARVLRIPPLPFGNNVNFKGFPFACRIRVPTLMAILSDLISFGMEEGIRKFVILNCHGGNDSTATAALRSIFDEFQSQAFVATCGCGCFTGEIHKRLFTDGSPHAGDFETSLMQFVAPEKLPNVEPLPSEMNTPMLGGLEHGVHWVRNWSDLMPSSCGGRPDLATPEKGREFFAADTNALAKFLVELSLAPWHPRFPYPVAS